ncbi:Basic-leucine zipper (bZIP) transcription factor [Neofusicoccum parvum]|nr:Basic-leucine zipper (bZIP) transcription factor [Neofusicoccum parvum]
MGDNNTAKDTPAAVGKSEEPSRDGSASSIATTPEPEAESYSAQEQPQQQQKRKGGRKPIYATSEERKQRNRQAQAAFRERRTEYIKQLESTIKHHEETLQTLQQNHRSAADECLMLRYKNSLLERILLEKGIDVQAELRAKTGSPHMGPTRVPPPGSAVQPPMQRAIMNRHQQARRSLVGFPQKVEGVQGSPLAQPDGSVPNHSPHSQPTPASHMSSPSTTATKSPNFIPTISPNMGPVSQSQQQQQQQQQQQIRPQPSRSQYNPLPPQRSSSLNTQFAAPSGLPNASSAGGNALAGNGNGPSAFYPSPFQSHMDQLGKLTRPLLQQEYDAQADMIDDRDPSEHSASTAPYPPQFPPNMQPQSTPQLQPPGSGQIAPQQFQGQDQYTSPAALQPADAQSGYAMSGNMNHGFDPYDPILDADPFGLSASMHFPTQFSYQTG